MSATRCYTCYAEPEHAVMIGNTSALANIDLLALIGRDTRLRRKAATQGGEYHGPCPFCGGRDRLRVQPNARPRPRWSCRSCHSDGRWHDAITYVQHRDGCDFRTACAVLQLDPHGPPGRPPRMPEPPHAVLPPGPVWQAMAGAFVTACQPTLWSAAGVRARAWLHRRGIDDDTALLAGLGYHAGERRDQRGGWGLDNPDQRLWLPRGIVIPWEIDGVLWRVNIRRPLTATQVAAGQKKYWQISGGRNALYGVQWLWAMHPAVVVESELDALAVQAACDDLVGCVATGSTGGSRPALWVQRLAHCTPVLVALDNDADLRKGEAAAHYWLDVLAPHAVRWRPWLKDVGAMVEAGMDVRSWIEAGVAAHE